MDGGPQHSGPGLGACGVSLVAVEGSAAKRSVGVKPVSDSRGGDPARSRRPLVGGRAGHLGLVVR